MNTSVKLPSGLGPADHAIHVISNPISALARLLYTNEAWLPPDTQARLRGKRPSAQMEELLSKAALRQEDKRFIGPLEKYKSYMDGASKELPKHRGKQVIFLDLENLCLRSKAGNYARNCVDDFSSITEVAPDFLHLYSRMEDKVRERMRKMIFWRLGVYDFPFTLIEEPSLGIVNPFAAVAEEVDDSMSDRGKSTLGSSLRYAHDSKSQANYHFSPVIFSEQAFNKFTSRAENLQSMMQAYNKKHDPLSEAEFLKMMSTAIKLNRKLCKMKYELLCDRLGIEEPYAYMLQGDIGMDLLRGANQNTTVIGGKLLQDAKNMPLAGVLEPQALNRLSGWLVARYEGTTPVVVKAKRSIPLPELVRSIKHPFLTTLGSPSDSNHAIDHMDAKALEWLNYDTKLYSFGIAPIEVVLVMLNYGNFSVYTKDGITPWSDLRQGKIQPLPIKHLSTFLRRPQFPGDEGALLRPSNSGSKCEYHRYLNVISTNHWKNEGLIFEQNEYAMSGSAMHTISNALQTTQHLRLPEVGIRAVERQEYCEVPISAEFTPNADHWGMAEQFLRKKHELSGSPLHKEMLDMLFASQATGIKISDGGSPNAVAIMEDTNELVINDFKRRMATYVPVQSFFQQTSRYALMLQQLLGLESKSFYSVIIQTPYSPNKFLYDPIMPAEGRYRSQVHRIRKINFDEQLMVHVGANMILEYLGGVIFSKDLSKGSLARQMYAYGAPGAADCKNCFANKHDSYPCHYSLTGEKGPWPEN
jgi:hypothetical protein